MGRSTSSGIILLMVLFAGTNLSAQVVADSSLAGVFRDQGKKSLQARHPDSAIVFFRQAAAAYRQTAEQTGAAAAWVDHFGCRRDIADCLKQQYRYDEALEFLNDALLDARDKLGSEQPAPCLPAWKKRSPF